MYVNIMQKVSDSEFIAQYCNQRVADRNGRGGGQGKQNHHQWVPSGIEQCGSLRNLGQIDKFTFNRFRSPTPSPPYPNLNPYRTLKEHVISHRLTQLRRAHAKNINSDISALTDYTHFLLRNKKLVYNKDLQTPRIREHGHNALCIKLH